MPTLVLLNNFAHDFSAAGWIFGAMLLWSIFKKNPASDDARKIVTELLETITFIMRLCFVGIVVFGVVRAVAYSTYEWNEAAGSSQVTLLIVKHILFLGIIVPSVFAYFKARKICKAGAK